MSNLTKTIANALTETENELGSQFLEAVVNDSISVELVYLLKVIDGEQQVQQQLTSMRRVTIKNFKNIEGKNHETSSCNRWDQD